MARSERKEFVLAGIVMTQGSFCLLENRSDGHTTTPIHVHAHDDETLYIIEGQLTAIVNGAARTLSPGESIFLKRGVPHQLVNPGSQPVRYILIGTPGMFDQFLAEAGHELRKGEAAAAPTPAEIDRLKEAAPRFGITLLRDWPAKA
jgi:mannose-6-phosphate isomerase-like protein (cupin superfamily)